MADRDSDITKFSYKSYRTFKKVLGEYDAIVECNELAIREFIEICDSSESYINKLSEKHGIYVHEVNIEKFKTKARHNYILSVCQQFEVFLFEFKDEWRKYFDPEIWKPREEKETKLKCCLRNTNIDLSSDLIDCYNYYRLVRNYACHSDRDLKKLDKTYDQINVNRNLFLNEMHLNHKPNRFDEISFEDFYILTNVVKHIAYLLSTKAKPSNIRIANLLFNLSVEGGEKRKSGIKKVKNNNQRYENAIRNYAVSTFGRFSSQDLDEVVTELKCLLA